MDAAVRAGNLDALRQLIDQDKKYHPVDPRWPSTRAMDQACEEAARTNQCAALESLLDNGCSISKDIVNVAIQANNRDILDTLLARGWDIDMETGHSGNSLVFSVASEDLDMVKFLLSRGANPNPTCLSDSALEKAAAVSTIPILRALLDAGGELKGSAALSRAAEHGRVDVISFLLDRGADINQVPNPDRVFDQCDRDEVKNALCTAAWRGDDKLVKFLLERGADVDVKDGKGQSALELARLGGHEPCVNLLTSHVTSKANV